MKIFLLPGLKIFIHLGMAEIKVWRFFITPQTDVKVTDNEMWMFNPKITHEYLVNYGREVHEKQVLEGKKKPQSPNWYINRKAVIKRYWDYKNAVKAIGDIERFVLPESDAWIKFYFPMPPSWTQKKRKQMEFTKHQSTPDADNCLKAFVDSLMKRDQMISDYRASKFWYGGAKGYIEVTLGELPPANGYTKVMWESNKSKLI